jgi:phospholipid/cholesterol/gamma-HCH transport system substrate-binding protein
MSKSRLEIKVGMFVLIGLVLLAIILLQFSKGTSLFRSTYNILLSTTSAGGLKRQASVLMAGVQIGTVQEISLAPSGTNVTITLRIYSKFVIRNDAVFLIKQSGFLGDNYVDIDPGQNLGTPLAPNARATAQEPFDLQGVARAAAGFLQRMDEAAKKINETIADVRRLVLNEQTLTNLSVSVGTMRSASDRALSAIENLDTLLSTNGAAVSTAASNIVVFSQELNRFALSLGDVLATNRESVSASMKNIESSTVTLKNLLEDVHAGKGSAGALLRNEQLATDIAAIASNLAVTTSNLNQRGLWGIMWSQKHPRTNTPPAKVQAPKDPFN